MAPGDPSAAATQAAARADEGARAAVAGIKSTAVSGDAQRRLARRALAKARDQQWMGASPQDSYNAFGKLATASVWGLERFERYLEQVTSYAAMARRTARSVKSTTDSHHDWEGFQNAMEKRWLKKNPVYEQWQKHTRRLGVEEEHLRRVLAQADRRGDAAESARVQEQLRELQESRGDRDKWLRRQHQLRKWDEHCHLEGLAKPYPPIDEEWAALVADPPMTAMVQGDLQSQLEKGLQRRALVLNPLWERWEELGGTGDPPLRWRRQQWAADAALRERCRGLGIEGEPPCSPDGPLHRDVRLCRPDLADPPAHLLHQQWRADPTLRQRCRVLHADLCERDFDSLDAFRAAAPSAALPGGLLLVDWALPRGFDGQGPAKTAVPSEEWLQSEWERNLTVRERSARAGFPEGPPTDQYVLPGGAEGMWRAPLDNFQSYADRIGPQVKEVSSAAPLVSKVPADVGRAVSGGDAAHSVERVFEAYHRAVDSGEIRRLTPQKQVELHRRVGAAADMYSGVVQRLCGAASGWREGSWEADLAWEPILRRPTGASAGDVFRAVGKSMAVPATAARGLAHSQSLGRANHRLAAGTDDWAPTADELQVRFDSIDQVSEAWRGASAADAASQDRFWRQGAHGMDEAGAASRRVWAAVSEDLSRRGTAVSTSLRTSDWQGARDQVAELGADVVARRVPLLPGDVHQLVHADVCLSGSMDVSWELHVCAHETIQWRDSVAGRRRTHEVNSVWLRLSSRDSENLEQELQRDCTRRRLLVQLLDCPSTVLRSFPYSTGNYRSLDGDMTPEESAERIAARLRTLARTRAQSAREARLRAEEEDAAAAEVLLVDADGSRVRFQAHPQPGAVQLQVNGEDRPIVTLCCLVPPKGDRSSFPGLDWLTGAEAGLWALSCGDCSEQTAVSLPPGAGGGLDAGVVRQLRSLLDDCGVQHNFDDHDHEAAGRRVRVAPKERLQELCADFDMEFGERQEERAGDAGRVVGGCEERGSVEVQFGDGGCAVSFPRAAVETIHGSAADDALHRIAGLLLKPDDSAARTDAAAPTDQLPVVIVDLLCPHVRDPSSGALHKLRRTGRGLRPPPEPTPSACIGRRPAQAVHVLQQRLMAAKQRDAAQREQRLADMKQRAAQAAQRVLSGGLAGSFVSRSRAGSEVDLGAALPPRRRNAARTSATAAALVIAVGHARARRRLARRRWRMLRAHWRDAVAAAVAADGAAAEDGPVDAAVAAAVGGRTAASLLDWGGADCYNPFRHSVPNPPQLAGRNEGGPREVVLRPPAARAHQLQQQRALADAGSSGGGTPQPPGIRDDGIDLSGGAFVPQTSAADAALRPRDFGREVRWPVGPAAQASFNPFKHRFPLPEECQDVQQRYSRHKAASGAVATGGVAAAVVAAVASWRGEAAVLGEGGSMAEGSSTASRLSAPPPSPTSPLAPEPRSAVPATATRPAVTALPHKPARATRGLVPSLAGIPMTPLIGSRRR
eukprot:TRINITY_DN26416_c0_g1_i2.p1 TRINITY_DN26416_c0_g1~~TRINITY_DN26416_c0_g1_i2.p1  ORF type:complete len:1495 (+),score=538.10 TRINITY_DN26416_c0_g1_i2:46-4485(+)